MERGCARKVRTVVRRIGVDEKFEALPLGREDIRRVRASVSGVSERRSCQVLGVSRASLHWTVSSVGRRRRPDPPSTE